MLSRNRIGTRRVHSRSVSRHEEAKLRKGPNQKVHECSEQPTKHWHHEGADEVEHSSEECVDHEYGHRGLDGELECGAQGH